MKVFIEKDNQTKEVPLSEETSCIDVLKQLEISREAVILVKNGSVCLDEEMLKDSDELKLLSVVSGG